MNAPEDQNGLREALARAEARVAELTRQVFVPGMLKCAKCGFVLISANLNAQDGTVTARDTTEHCPNDGAPMWRVSERESGNDMADRADEQMRRALAAEAELDEERQESARLALAVTEGQAEITRLKEGMEALGAALKPFAKAADAYPISPVARRENRRRCEVVWSYGSEDAGNRREIAVSDLREARQALATLSPKEHP